MKRTLPIALIVAAMSSAPQISNAALLVGISDFDQPSNPASQDNPADPSYSASNFSGGFVYFNGQATNGSADGTWGPAVGLSPAPGANDGAGGGAFLFHGGVGTFYVNASMSAAPTQLGFLLFDAALLASGSASLSVNYAITNGVTIKSSGTLSLQPNATVTNVTLFDYKDFFVNLSTLSLVAGDSIQFVFSTNGGNVSLDNLALTSFDSAGVGGIPEPGSLLALGCLMGGGAFMRSRRRR